MVFSDVAFYPKWTNTHDPGPQDTVSLSSTTDSSAHLFLTTTNLISQLPVMIQISWMRGFWPADTTATVAGSHMVQSTPVTVGSTSCWHHLWAQSRKMAFGWRGSRNSGKHTSSHPCYELPAKKSVFLKSIFHSSEYKNWTQHYHCMHLTFSSFILN